MRWSKAFTRPCWLESLSKLWRAIEIKFEKVIKAKLKERFSWWELIDFKNKVGFNWMRPNLGDDQTLQSHENALWSEMGRFPAWKSSSWGLWDSRVRNFRILNSADFFTWSASKLLFCISFIRIWIFRTYLTHLLSKNCINFSMSTKGQYLRLFQGFLWEFLHLGSRN